ncbi:hypothetical protein F9K85_20455 [Brucella tritici]|jgi:hypothetical protein|uniref:Uncharacterized protein n=1 Tax=Brucella tritici TaxID=94626 RepID=A0A6L3YCJ2_9HYPH|nr:hypothetical protein [Brucella tritici]KAB2663439.1 hypothetical protein F9K91_18685 [Brucella tritici]KAB2673392.1 hypothetical protein F9K85_20455 [Brucella tritici]KAB2681745.1 hypothetical protein F9L08_18945 [Brucella tritici]
MSLYLKSWLFTCWIVALIFTISYWLPLFEQLPEPLGLIAGFAFFVGHALAMLYGFYCPECGLSVYQSKKGFIVGYGPIPHRNCGHCGRDHSRTE